MKLSEHFDSSEFKCHCCGSLGPGISKVLIEKLETLRTQLGLPIFVASGYRCPAHNKAVGGVSNSQHLLGKAADITVKAMKPGDVANAAERLFDPGGLGRYAGFTHVDVRAAKSRWGLPALPNIAPAPPDEASAWAKESWKKFTNLGIVDGTNPQGDITREQVVVVVDRALEKLTEAGGE